VIVFVSPPLQKPNLLPGGVLELVFRIERAGVLTSWQHFGEYHQRTYGVRSGGVMDRYSAMAVNLLVGNEAQQPIFEIHQNGVHLQFHDDALIALGGAQMRATIGERVCSLWRPHLIRAGEWLEILPWQQGMWGYLAIANTRSKITNAIYKKVASHSVKWSVSCDFLPFSVDSPFQRTRTIRIVRGQHFSILDESQQSAWFSSTFTLTPKMSRMGYRFHFDNKMNGVYEQQSLGLLHSQPVVPGTIQLPANLEPIILMADAQTVGGYPVVAHVASIDLGKVAQMQVGQRLQFAEISLDEAHRLLKEHSKNLEQLKVGIRCWALTSM
jgi:antagonist of KipI